MSGGESYGAVVHPNNNVVGIQSPPQAAASMQNMRLAYAADGGGAAVYKTMVVPTSSPSPTHLPPITPNPSYQPQPPASGGGGAVIVGTGGSGVVEGGIATAAAAQSTTINSSSTGGEVAKRKRGRPRKYGPSDGTMAGTVVKSPPAAVQSSCFSSPPPPPPTTTNTAAEPAVYSGKKRGRPLGSGRKQQLLAASGSAGVGFTPHIITVKAGEDLLAKLMSFSQNNTKAVCILSANGAISNVTLRQAATSGGTVTYEGRFEILYLSGSFMVSESSGQRSRTGGLSVSLAGPDGRVLGGGVAGLLTAAAPVQVIIGTFATDLNQSKSGQELAAGVPTAGSPPSYRTQSESSGGPGSPLNQSTRACNNSNPQGLPDICWR